MLAFVVLLCDEDTLTEEVLVDLLALGSGDKHLVGIVFGEKEVVVEVASLVVLQFQNHVVRKQGGDQG